MNRKLAAIAAAIALIVIIVVFAILRKPDAKAPTTEQPIVNKNPPIIQAGTVPSLAIDSPQPAGETITVKKVTLPLHGFVVIRDGSSNKIVGASNVIIFPETADMKIAATVTANKTYLAEIHADGDNNGIFDAKVDPPFIVSGKTVTATFRVK
jgi:hypothetical protein